MVRLLPLLRTVISGSAPINENRPDSSFFSADSNKKQGPRPWILAKAETGVSTSATKLAMTGIRSPCPAMIRNCSSDGVMHVGVIGRVAITSSPKATADAPAFTLALHAIAKAGAGDETRTRDVLLGKE